MNILVDQSKKKNPIGCEVAWTAKVLKQSCVRQCRRILENGIAVKMYGVTDIKQDLKIFFAKWHFPSSKQFCKQKYER